jgi:small-conductance mechanosensitive channel
MPKWDDWVALGIGVAFALFAVLVIAVVVTVVARAAAKRHDWAKALVSNARHPFRLLVLVIALWSAFSANQIFTAKWDDGKTTWNDTISHAFEILTIVFVAWLIGALLSFGIGLAMGRYRTDVRDNRVARRVQTQLAIVRRLSIVVVVIIGAASILLTFPGVQALGASLLASAGLVSIVAGLAAQSSLANLFAGVQLAFSDAIRVDDVVVVETQWGKIEEITLTYVVVHIWDDRRMVLPSTYFTTTPFENWTRRSSELLGSVDFDLGWRVSPSEMRVKLDEVLSKTTLWDKRASVLQVTDAVGGFVHIRVLVTAIDAPTLFDLRCYVREQLVEWLHEKDVSALPVTRVQMVDEPVRARPKAPTTDTGGLFTGSPEAEHRAETFTTAIPLPHHEGTPDAPEPGAN